MKDNNKKKLLLIANNDELDKSTINNNLDYAVKNNLDLVIIFMLDIKKLYYDDLISCEITKIKEKINYIKITMADDCFAYKIKFIKNKKDIQKIMEICKSEEYIQIEDCNLEKVRNK